MKRVIASALLLALLMSFCGCRGNEYDKYCELGQEHLSNGDYEQAIENLECAVKIEPKSSKAWELLGDAYVGAGSYEDATDSYERAVKVGFGAPSAADKLADTYDLIGEHDKAKELRQRDDGAEPTEDAPINLEGVDSLMVYGDEMPRVETRDGLAFVCDNGMLYRCSLSTGEAKIIYSGESNLFAVTNEYVYAANTTYYSNSFGPTYLLRAPIEGGDWQDIGEFRICAFELVPLPSGRIALFGARAGEDFSPDPSYNIVVVDADGSVIRGPESTDIYAFTGNYGIMGRLTVSDGEKTYYANQSYRSSATDVMLLDADARAEKLASASGILELVAITDDALYLSNNTGSQFAYVTISEVCKYDLKSGGLSSVDIPARYDGARLIKIGGACGDWLYLWYSYTADNEYEPYARAEHYRFNTLTGEMIPISTASAPTADPDGENRTVTVKANGGLRLRSGPGTDYEVLELIADGARISVLDEENGWYKTSYNGKTGWVSAEYCN